MGRTRRFLASSMVRTARAGSISCWKRTFPWYSIMVPQPETMPSKPRERRFSSLTKPLDRPVHMKTRWPASRALRMPSLQEAGMRLWKSQRVPSISKNRAFLVKGIRSLSIHQIQFSAMSKNVPYPEEIFQWTKNHADEFWSGLW